MIEEPIQILLGALLGACLGSYFGCALWRIPRRIPLTGQSFCPGCGKTIPGYLNLPLISFILLKGKSRCCKKKLARVYLLAEALTVLAGGLLGWWIDDWRIALGLGVAGLAIPLIISLWTLKNKA